MRLSPLVILSSSLIITTVAAPVQQASQNDVNNTFLQDFGNSLTSQLSATISGAVDAVKQFLTNPALTVARIQVVQGLNETTDAVTKVSADANSTDNAGVQSLVTQAQAGLGQIVAAVGRIGQAISSGTTPDKNDQKLVAEGINTAATAINSMQGAVTNQDAGLSSDIQAAITGVTDLINGAQAVLAASNISIADLGLSSNSGNDSSADSSNSGNDSSADSSDSGNDSSADGAGDDTGSNTASNGGNGNDVSTDGGEDTGVSAGTDGATIDNGNGNQASASDSGSDAGELDGSA